MANYEILKKDEASKEKENILSDDRKISSQEIITTGENVEKRGAGKTYNELWEQHKAEIALFDLQLETAKKDKKAENILIDARKENLATEGKQTRVKTELAKINTLLNKTGTASIENTLGDSLTQIGKILPDQLTKIATNLKLTDSTALAGLVDVCKECTAGEFNIETVRAVGMVQFFAKEQYLKDVKEAYDNGKKYGIDRSAGTATFMTIRKILDAYFALPEVKSVSETKAPEKEEKNKAPEKEEKGPEKTDEVFAAIEKEKEGEKKEVKAIRKDLTEEQKTQAKTIYSKLITLSTDNDITTELSNKNDLNIIKGVNELLVKKIGLPTTTTTEKTKLENIAQKILAREEEINNAGKNIPEKEKEKKEEKKGEDLKDLLSSITPRYLLLTDKNTEKGSTARDIGYEMVPSNDEKPKEYQERASLLMLNYITVNGKKLIDMKDKITKYEYDKDSNTFTLEIKTTEKKAEGNTEDKILKLKFNLKEDPKFGNRVEFNVTCDDKQITAGKFMTYDVLVPTTSEKEDDVRATYNRAKTIENIKKETAYSIEKPFETKLSAYDNLDFLKEIKLNDELDIDKQLIPIDKADLSDDSKYEGIDAYYKKIYINYQGDHKEIGKIYFKKDGTLDTTKLKEAELKIYGVDLKPTFEASKDAKTVNLNIADAQLKELNDKINKEKSQITGGLTSLSKNVNTSLMPNLQREKLQDISNIALYPLRDLYSYNVIEGKNTTKKSVDTKTNIYFKFDDKDAINITNYFGENTNNKAIVEVQDTKKGGKTIQRDFELTLTGSNLTSSDATEKTAAEALPTVNGVTLPKNALYDISAKTLQYYTDKGVLSSSIACKTPKMEKDSKRELLDNNTVVDPLDLFDAIKIGTCATLGGTEKENIFKTLMSKKLDNKLTRPNTIRVLKDDSKMIYEYYSITDNKDGTFTAEKDKDLINAANTAMEKMKNDFLIIDKINTISLKLWEKVTKKEKDLSINSGLGGIGMCNVSADQIIKFIQSDEKSREIPATIGKDESTENLTTNKIEFLPKDQVITFSIKKDKIDSKNASTTIGSESYILDYDEDGNKLLLEKAKATNNKKKN